MGNVMCTSLSLGLGGRAEFSACFNCGWAMSVKWAGSTGEAFTGCLSHIGIYDTNESTFRIISVPGLKKKCKCRSILNNLINTKNFSYFVSFFRL